MLCSQQYLISSLHISWGLLLPAGNGKKYSLLAWCLTLLLGKRENWFSSKVSEISYSWKRTPGQSILVHQWQSEAFQYPVSSELLTCLWLNWPCSLRLEKTFLKPERQGLRFLSVWLVGWFCFAFPCAQGTICFLRFSLFRTIMQLQTWDSGDYPALSLGHNVVVAFVSGLMRRWRNKLCFMLGWNREEFPWTSWKSLLIAWLLAAVWMDLRVTGAVTLLCVPKLFSYTGSFRTIRTRTWWSNVQL